MSEILESRLETAELQILNLKKIIALDKTFIRYARLKIIELDSILVRYLTTREIEFN